VTTSLIELNESVIAKLRDIFLCQRDESETLSHNLHKPAFVLPFFEGDLIVAAGIKWIQTE
jgi:hypothetical protein